MTKFSSEMEHHQSNWRRSAGLSSTQFGWQNRRQYEWILPKHLWEEGLWQGIRRNSIDSIQSYIDDPNNKIKKHSGSHNLKSSWILCANLYFPFGRSDPGRALLASFLRDRVDQRIQTVDAVELEYEEPRDSELHPSRLLGEADGARGAGQTSPDIAFLVNGDRGGLVLTEVKFTEHSFYPCSARRRDDGRDRGRPGNLRPDRCENLVSVLADPATQCHQVKWGRKYWEHLKPIMSQSISSGCCPAAYTGYQLFRQQALAEGIAASAKYDFVVSSATIDDRNEALKASLKSLGWESLFAGKARFSVFTHQNWVNWVRTHDASGEWTDWLRYVEQRYGFRNPT